MFNVAKKFFLQIIEFSFLLEKNIIKIQRLYILNYKDSKNL